MSFANKTLHNSIQTHSRHDEIGAGDDVTSVHLRRSYIISGCPMAKE